MQRPNFFILGGPKCGTTALSEYLREHPRVFFSDPKEPHFFSTDFPNHRAVKTAEEYDDLFRDAGPDHLAVGEASVFYLYSRVAAQRILEFEPRARSIVMLRNPVDMVASMHAQFLLTLIENKASFEEAWRLQETRKEGREVPTGIQPEFLQYRELCSLGEQVRRLLTVYPREQVHLVLLDDLAREPRETYERVLSFLDLPPDGRADFPRINENRANRSRALAHLAAWRPAPLEAVLSAIRRGLRVQSLGSLRYRLREANTATRARQPLSASTRRELFEAFDEDVRLLSELTGRDLSSWDPDMAAGSAA